MTISGTRISGGMIYVGDNLPSPGNWGPDRCLINPSLRVAREFRPGDEAGLHYWPDYASISPSGRRAYLDWLAGGRSDPVANIGLVFLFFYGLERRLFHERVVAEADVLVAEVERLLGIYGSNGSFRGYAANFLSASSLVVGGGPRRVEPSPVPNWQPEMPFSTLLHLGTALAEGRPLGADDSLLWVLGWHEARLRTPGQRCFDEFRQLFAACFAERHPDGLKVRAPKKRISAVYRAASGTFTSPIPGPHENLPDISAITAPLAGLRDMLDASQTELEAYSRLLGRKPHARGTLEAAVLLPPLLRERAMREAATAARGAVVPLLRGASFAAVTPRAILAALDMPVGDEVAKLSPGLAAGMGGRLDALGFGVEPDRRYGGGSVPLAAEVILFEAPGGAPVDPDKPAYVRATAALEIGGLAAAADGDVSDAEFAALVRDARSAAGLGDAERLRLEAFVWTLRARTKSGTAVRKAAGLPLEARTAISRAAIAATLADGRTSAAEVAFLERLHRSLGLPPEMVHAALHQGAGGLVPGSAPISSNATAGRVGLSLDAGRLARIRQETSEVSSLLSGIFSEEPDDALAESVPRLPAPAVAAASPYEGLDGAHGALLTAVGEAGRMPIAAFERMVRELRLLPEGAIETVNDWAFDRFGDALLETDDEAVSVAEHLRTDLLNARGTA